MTTVILESALRTLLLVVIVWVFLQVFRVSHVVAQKIAWCLVLAAAMTMPFLVQWQPFKFATPFMLPTHWTTGPLPEAQMRAKTRTAISSLTTPLAPRTSGERASGESHVKMAELYGFASVAYLIGCATLLLRLLFGLILAFRIWRRAQPNSGSTASLAAVRISCDTSTPFTIGSSIVLPSSFSEWDAAKLHMVLAHEHSHIVQADFYLQVLARTHTAIFWFNPVAWWLQKILSDLGEAVSDYAAIREAPNRHSYAEMLLEFAAMPRRSLVGIAMARSSRIDQRIDRILSDALFRRAFIRRKLHAFVACSIVILSLFASMSLVVVRASENVATLNKDAGTSVLQSSISPPRPVNRASSEINVDRLRLSKMVEYGAQKAANSTTQSHSESVATSQIYRVGGGVSAPSLIFAPDPEFTDEARRANYQGICVVAVIVDSQGSPQRPQVVRHLGMGLDKKAIEAVRGYRFRPAMMYGKPIAVELTLQVNFSRN
jgi:TonB family protein